MTRISLVVLGLVFGLIFTMPYQKTLAQDDSNQDLAVVSINENVNNIPTGRVYIYDQNYSLIRLLDSAEAPTSGKLDGDIIFKNNQIILATPSREIEKSNPDSGPLTKTGAVSFFDGFTGALIRTIWNPEPNTTPEYVGGSFGSAITFLGSRVVIGNANHDVKGAYSAGSVYIYDNLGNLQRTINNPNPTDGAAFGASLLSFDDKIIVGIPGMAVDENENAGAISVFDSNGSILSTINNPNPTPYARFGFSMDIEKTEIAVSAPYATIDGYENVGEVYLFDANTGELLKTIKNPDPNEGDKFGRSVIFAGSKVIVGAVGGGLYDEGSVYIFDAESGRLLNIIPSPQRTGKSGINSNEFGTSLALDGNRLAIGDPNGMVGDIMSGIAYIFDLTTGEILETISNPTPEQGDAFGYYLEFIGNMESTNDPIFESEKQKDAPGFSEIISTEKSSNSKFDLKNETGVTFKNIRWLEEDEADYTIGGIGVILLDDQDLNVDKNLINTYNVHVWSNTDKNGILVNVIETGVNTGIFQADINLSGLESSPLQLHVSIGDTITVSFEDETLDKPLTDSIKIASKNLPPFRQKDLGVPIDEISCDDQYKLIIKNNHKPLCLRQKTYEILVQRGFFNS